MKKSVAKAIKNLVKRECQARGIQYHKAYYRRSKKTYVSIPHTQKHLVG